jgi:outer membrane protein assembly factor BamB
MFGAPFFHSNMGSNERLGMKKRQAVYFLIMLFLIPLPILVASLMPMGQSQDESWPMFHQNLQRTGYLDTSPPTTNQTLWKFNTGGQMGSPAVQDSIVYIGGYDHKVYAFNVQTGKLIWNYTTGGIIVSRPAIASGLVYVGSEDNNLYALNATDGSLIWKYPTGYYVDSDPTVVNDVVYMASEDRNVYALNAQTGEKIWSYTTGGQIMLSSPKSR